MTKTKRFMPVTLVVLGTALSGCTSLGLGEGEYSCKGIPDGVSCMSAKEVYQATNNGNRLVAPLSEQNNGSANGVSSVFGDSYYSNSMGVVEQTAITSSSSDPIVDSYVVPNIPDTAVPIRTHAQVMRIWIAPWEDQNGDFVAASEIYTDIEPRKWVFANEL